MKTNKRRGAKTPTNEYARANLKLDAEVYRRLLIASVMENRPAGEIVTRMLAEYLKRWSLPSDLSARVKSSDRQTPELQASESEAIAA